MILSTQTLLAIQSYAAEGKRNRLYALASIELYNRRKASLKPFEINSNGNLTLDALRKVYR